MRTYLECPDQHPDPDTGHPVRVGSHKSGPTLQRLADGRCPACPDQQLTLTATELYSRQVPVGDCPCCKARWYLPDPDNWVCLEQGRLEQRAYGQPGRGARARDRARHKSQRYRQLVASLREGMPAAEVTPDDVRAGLAEAGNRRADAEQARDEALTDVSVWLSAGLERGLAVQEMATLAGITRQTAYTFLRDS